MRKLILILLPSLLGLQLFAQEIIQGDMNVWFLLQDRVTLNQKWSITNELHLRNNNYFHTASQFLERPSIDYHFGNDLEGSLGYSFIRSTPVLGNTQVFYRNENNIWAQIFHTSKVGRFRFQHRLRQEFRWVNHVEQSSESFVISGNDFLKRFRYRFIALIDLASLAGHTLFLNFFDEVWINQDANLGFTNFNRNWLYCGIGYKLRDDEIIQLGFMNQRDRLISGDFSRTPIVQASFTRNFKLRKG